MAVNRVIRISSRDLEVSRAGSRVSTDQIQNWDSSELNQRLGSSLLSTSWGKIEISRAWLPDGPCSARNVVNVHSILASEEDREIAAIVQARMALLTWYVPAKTKTGYGFVKPASMMTRLACLRIVLGICAARPKRSEGRLLDRISANELLQVLRKKYVHGLIEWISYLESRGLWSDGFHKEDTNPSAIDILQTELATLPAVEPYAPLPDKFVAELGWRMIWLVENLTPALIRCTRIVMAARSKVRGRTHRERQARLTNATALALGRFKWKSPGGEDIEHLPFVVRASYGSRNGKSEFEWPPKQIRDLTVLQGLVQDANLFLFALPTGGRISECASLRTDCIVEDKESAGIVRGRTFKLVALIDGQLRTWPLPDLSVRALRQQIELSKVLSKVADSRRRTGVRKEKKMVADSLWVTFSGMPIRASYNQRLSTTIKHLGLESMLEGTDAHMHRFRKTIARIVALAVVGAPKILMDLFGHKDISMTLHYILTDPGIRAEAEVVAKAQTIMLAETAIENIESCGGKAAPAIRQFRDKERARLGDEFGAPTVRSLAEMLTDGGQNWALVREGTVCTKRPEQVGPCNEGTGIVDPARCRSGCGHRLELHTAKADVDASLASQVAHYEAANADGNEYEMMYWSGQILAALPRYPDLMEKWRKHPTVEKVCSRRDSSIEFTHPFDVRESVLS